MSNPMGGVAAVGPFSPLELGLMGGAMAIPAGIAAYQWWNSGESDPSEPRYGRPGDPPHPNDGPTKQLSDFFMRSGELRKKHDWQALDRTRRLGQRKTLELSDDT